MKQAAQLLIELFEQWGKPKAIRSDNGSPIGVPDRNIVPILSLWLAAYGIRHILNRPRRPTDNANVENNQNTSARWADVYNCDDYIQMQEKLDEICVYQREFFKVSRLGQVTRKQLYPKLYSIPTPFDPKDFDVQKAYQLLEKATFPRRVSCNGTISIYSHVFSIGRTYKRQDVILTFCGQQVAWIAHDPKGEQIKVIPDTRFSKENIYNLTVCQ